MSTRLKTDEKVVGVKQVRRALISQEVKVVYIARDADRHVIDDIKELSEKEKVQVVEMDSMKELGDACGIDVSAAVAALIKIQ